MTLSELERRGRDEVYKDTRYACYISEFNGEHNKISRAKIRAMRRERGSCFIWTCNPYKKGSVVREYTAGMVFNFDGSFVTPRYDPELERLMRERLDSPYAGVGQDARRIDAIYDRAEQLGKVNLFWS